MLPTLPLSVISTNLVLGLGCLRVRVVRHYALMGEISVSGRTISVIDVSDPTTPALLGNLNAADSSTDLVVVGNNIFVTSIGNHIRTYDWSNPLLLVQTGDLGIGGLSPVCIAAQGRYLYTCGTFIFNDFRVIDAIDPTHLVQVGVVADAIHLLYGCDIIPDGQYAYVKSLEYFTVIDISNPIIPIVAASIKAFAGELTGNGRMQKIGRYVYTVFYTNNKLTIIDVNNPLLPVVVGSITDAVNLLNPVDIAVVGGYAFVGISGQITVCDVSIPTMPVVLQTVATHAPANLNSIALAAAYLYCASQAGPYFQVMGFHLPPSVSTLPATGVT